MALQQHSMQFTGTYSQQVTAAGRAVLGATPGQGFADVPCGRGGPSTCHGGDAVQMLFAQSASQVSNTDRTLLHVLAPRCVESTTFLQCRDVPAEAAVLAELRDHVLSKLCTVMITVLNTLKVAHTEVRSKHGRRSVPQLAALDMQSTNHYWPRQEVLCKLFAADTEKQAQGIMPYAARAAGLLSLCLTLLPNAAAMSASLRRTVAEHLLPAAISLSRAAHALLMGNTGFQQQHRTAMLVFMAVCSSRCVCMGPQCLTGS